MKESR